MGNPMMTDKAPINVTEWSPEHVRKYLEKHMKSLHFKEDAINKLLKISPASVEVITATEFEKFCENNKRQLEKLNKIMNTVITDIDHLSSDVNTTKEDIRGINGYLMI
ncbi:3323_t:CDS:2 [Funneliformis caledonium]|uniref:3323_t:CDS:1 n=1 Tax=Funneliformis caledonium TaxID=1117310 RepID=A0A9N9JB10_9GLOM|nr:3323_t:CDS:2 [Funneliformis caledonium]